MRSALTHPNPSRRITRRALVGAGLATLAFAACGDSPKTAVDAVADLESDPLALLPGSGVALARLDVRAFYASSTVGPDVAQVVSQLLPMGAEAGFDPAKDVDTILSGGYTTQGADVAAIVSGRFDEERIRRAAEGATLTRAGGRIVASTYAGRKVYTVNNIGFAVLSSKTVIAGTEGGIRRTLEKIQDKRTKRAFPAWMIETIETKGVQFAIAIDVSAQPLTSVNVASIDLTQYLKGMRAARVLGDFQDPGMNVAATISYTEDAQAAAGADALRNVEGWLKFLGPLMGVPRLRSFEANAQAADVRVKFGVDGEGLRGAIRMLPRLLTTH